MTIQPNLIALWTASPKVSRTAAEAKIDDLLQRKNINAIAGRAEACPLSVFSRCGWPETGRPRAFAALCRRRLQCVRPAQRVAPDGYRAFDTAPKRVLSGSAPQRRLTDFQPISPPDRHNLCIEDRC